MSYINVNLTILAYHNQSIVDNHTMNNFYFWVFSDASADIYPNNTISNFRNHIHTPIELEDGMYEVALVKCSYIYSKPCIKKGDKLCDLVFAKRNRFTRSVNPDIEFEQDESDIVFEFQDEIDQYLTLYAQKNLYTIEELCNHLSKLDNQLIFTRRKDYVV